MPKWLKMHECHHYKKADPEPCANEHCFKMRKCELRRAKEKISELEAKAAERCNVRCVIITEQDKRITELELGNGSLRVRNELLRRQSKDEDIKRQADINRAEAAEATVKELREIVGDSLHSFDITQSGATYPRTHWSVRARIATARAKRSS